MQINRKAPVCIRREVTVAAPAELIWSMQTDVEQWSSWVEGMGSSKLHEDFSVGGKLTFRTGPIEFDTTIEAVEEPHLFALRARAKGATALQIWRFTPVGEGDAGCHVVVEESIEGMPVKLMRKRIFSMVDGFLHRWTQKLKVRAEAV